MKHEAGCTLASARAREILCCACCDAVVHSVETIGRMGDHVKQVGDATKPCRNKSQQTMPEATYATKRDAPTILYMMKPFVALLCGTAMLLQTPSPQHLVIASQGAPNTPKEKHTDGGTL